ncbi:hypothetical protein PQX77_011922 [Marasmius sp. AFHP31]|nr:hypothetical protein PQX77_011922 [Marasmius sp. AFHP31]
MNYDYQQGPSNPTLFYDGPDYGAFWETVAELGVSIYLHPRVNIPAMFNHLYKDGLWLGGAAQEFTTALSSHPQVVCELSFRSLPLKLPSDIWVKGCHLTFSVSMVMSGPKGHFVSVVPTPWDSVQLKEDSRFTDEEKTLRLLTIQHPSNILHLLLDPLVPVPQETAWDRACPILGQFSLRNSLSK